MAFIRHVVRAFLALQICLTTSFTNAQEITLDLSDPTSIKTAARQLAESCMNFYNGDEPGGVPGLLPPSAAGQFNWWEAGALFGQMVEYWHYTGDDTWNAATTEALLFQVGPNNNYEPTNQSLTEGNDDQVYWAFAAMSAAETKFPNPDPNQPQWLALAQAVFNRQAARWDDENCNGGLRWQFNPLNNGYDNKNTITNGGFFQLAARLARYTQNSTYADWANKAYDWLVQSPLINNQTWEVYDSINFDDQAKVCPSGPVGQVQWTYNIGTLIVGSAYMYNYTNGDPQWMQRLNGYLQNTQRVFFPAQYGGNIMTEYACESVDKCDKDQRSFKASLSRWLALTVALAPPTAKQILPWIQGSAQAAVKQCVAGPGGNVAGGPVACGEKWYLAQDDGERDIGNQMTVMSIIQANLVQQVAGPADSNTGTSTGDASAGNGPSSPFGGAENIATREITIGDKIGAGLLTALVLVATLAFLVTLLSDDLDMGKLVGAVGSLPARTKWYGT